MISHFRQLTIFRKLVECVKKRDEDEDTDKV